MEGDEVQEVNLQITGLTVKWAFRDWGGGSVPSTGGQCTPSRQSSSTAPSYKHLTRRGQISLLWGVCVRERERRRERDEGIPGSVFYDLCQVSVEENLLSFLVLQVKGAPVSPEQAS